jgi:hypothetical protein
MAAPLGLNSLPSEQALCKKFLRPRSNRASKFENLRRGQRHEDSRPET